MPQSGLSTKASETGQPERAIRRISFVLAFALVLFGASAPAEEALPKYPAASEAVEAPDDTEAFRSAMSQGLAALSQGRPGAARKAFERAATLQPEDPAAREGLFQANLATRLGALATMKKRALSFEQREEWSEAAAVYRTALAQYPELVFARTGLRRSEERGGLLGHLDQLISHPDRLESRAVLEQARSLAERGETVAEDGTTTAERAQELQRLIEAASTAIPVNFLSDGQTQVLVYKVGNLGSFERREVALHPGNYTVIGSRNGYRDVRKQIRIESGKTPDVVQVICEEPLL